MSGDGVIQRESVDKFSDLPDDVIDVILSLIPLEDAVRTSILSKKWRLHWTRIQSLELDWDFFCEVLDHDPENEMLFGVAAYASAVDNILSSHCGPIRELYFHVPAFESPPHLHPNAVDNWIHSVSLCGVQNLTLDFDDAHPLPSSLFQCTELKHLCLRFVKLAPPFHHFRKLSSLVSLDILCATLAIDMLTSIIANCPLLERFSFMYMGSIEYGPYIISDPKLKHLSVQYEMNIFFALKNNPNISTLSIQRVGLFCGEDHNKDVQDIVDFFGAVPRIESIDLHSDVLVQWAKEDVPERLPALLEKHTSLIINDMDMSSRGQLHSLFCLIKSSPKLQILEISMCLSHDYEPQDTGDYLQSQLRQARNLRSLKTVKLAHLMGDKPEIIFIEIILSWCPNLEKLYLTSNDHITSEAEHRLTTNITRFRQASTQAEIIYSKLE